MARKARYNKIAFTIGIAAHARGLYTPTKPSPSTKARAANTRYHPIIRIIQNVHTRICKARCLNKKMSTNTKKAEIDMIAVKAQG